MAGDLINATTAGYAFLGVVVAGVYYLYQNPKQKQKVTSTKLAGKKISGVDKSSSVESKEKPQKKEKKKREHRTAPVSSGDDTPRAQTTSVRAADRDEEGHGQREIC